jgi:hypothetical protein
MSRRPSPFGLDRVNAFDKRWQSLVTKGDSQAAQRTADRTLAFHCTNSVSGLIGRWVLADEARRRQPVASCGLCGICGVTVRRRRSTTQPSLGRIATNDFAVVIGGTEERPRVDSLIDESASLRLGDIMSSLVTGHRPMIVE